MKGRRFFSFGSKSGGDLNNINTLIQIFYVLLQSDGETAINIPKTRISINQ